MKQYFEPKSIAVLGATSSEGKMGNRFVRALAEWSGTLYAVHPTETSVEGCETVPSLADLPAPVDLLVALVPAAALVGALERLPRGGAAYLASIPAGFGEASEAGGEMERKLVAIARERAVRVVGPNILGVVNAPYGLNASMIPTLPPAAPGFSLLTQSGGFAMNLWMYAQNNGFGIAKMCDLGNTSDVAPAEVLRYFRDDDDTQVVGIFLESVRGAASMRAELEALAVEKTVLLTTIGRTNEGRRASVAHLGLHSEALDVPAGVLRPETGQELLDVAKALTWQPRPRGKRVAILTGTGGVGTEITDLCVEHGLEVPLLSTELQAKLAAPLPEFAPVGNPVDLTPIWPRFPELYPPLLADMASSGEIDLLILTVTDVPTALPEMADAVATLALEVPVYVYWGAHPEGAAGFRRAQRERVPCFLDARATVRAAAAAAR